MKFEHDYDRSFDRWVSGGTKVWFGLTWPATDGRYYFGIYTPETNDECNKYQPWVKPQSSSK
jgi:hypothetical protein